MPKESTPINVSADDLKKWLECLSLLTSQIQDLGKVEISPVMSPNIKEKVGRKLGVVALELLESASAVSSKIKRDLGVPERSE